jgi:hypothetical protein
VLIDSKLVRVFPSPMDAGHWRPRGPSSVLRLTYSGDSLRQLHLAQMIVSVCGVCTPHVRCERDLGPVVLTPGRLMSEPAVCSSHWASRWLAVSPELTRTACFPPAAAHCLRRGHQSLVNCHFCILHFTAANVG